MRITQGHAHQIAPIGQVGHQSSRIGVFGNVFVDAAVFGLTEHGGVGTRRIFVVLFEDQISLLAVFKENVQAFPNPFGANGVRCHLGFSIHQLVFFARLGLNDDGLALCASTLRDVSGLIDLVLASNAEQFVFLRHDLGMQ